ncbi:MAG: hypothetical protein COA91_04565 [Robiginitomaculum sp.]|nr:MAG: hypothetical protein COA91_04565 [Robiginitomaculum sp.]
MKKLTAILSTALLGLIAVTASATERPDIYVVKFRADDCATCGLMETQLDTAMKMVSGSKVELVTIDTTNLLQWEKSAHTAFDRDFVPQFNKWVGLTGFVAVIDRRSRRTIGCVSDKQNAYKMANLIKSAAGLPHDQAISNRTTQFKCPATLNVDPGK